MQRDTVCAIFWLLPCRWHKCNGRLELGSLVIGQGRMILPFWQKPRTVRAFFLHLSFSRLLSMEERFAISMMRLGAARRADSDVIDNPPLLPVKRSRTSAGSAETLDTNSITNTRGDRHRTARSFRIPDCFVLRRLVIGWHSLSLTVNRRGDATASGKKWHDSFICNCVLTLQIKIARIES